MNGNTLGKTLKMVYSGSLNILFLMVVNSWINNQLSPSDFSQDICSIKYKLKQWFLEEQKCQNEYILKGDLVEGFSSCGLTSPIITVSWHKDQESGDFSIHKDGCLCWFCICVGVSKKQVQLPVKYCPRSMTNELNSKSEGKQARTRASFFSALHMLLSPESVA